MGRAEGWLGVGSVAVGVSAVLLAAGSLAGLPGSGLPGPGPGSGDVEVVMLSADPPADEGGQSSPAPQLGGETVEVRSPARRAAKRPVGGAEAERPPGLRPDGPRRPPGVLGIPDVVLAAYREAAAAQARNDPSCRLSWELLAGVGVVESGHAFGGRVDRDGDTWDRIVGPRLDGAGDYARILDSDDGRLDDDTEFDRAVGPMQFLPGTWASWGRDGNGDGRADPHNVFDATRAAAAYLCAGGWDLSTDAGRRSALLTYNGSQSYVDLVLAWTEAYEQGLYRPTGLAGGSPSPTASPTPTPTTSPSPSPKATQTPSPTPTRTATPSPTPTATPTPSPTPTPTPSPTPTGTESPSPTPTGTESPAATPTGTDSPTGAPSESATP